MRDKLSIAAVLLGSMVGSFWLTSTVLEGKSADSPGVWAYSGLGGAPLIALPALPGILSLQQGAALKPAQDGLELVSEFSDVAGKSAHTYGAVLYQIRDARKVLSSTATTVLAVEITKPLVAGEAAHRIELNYEQAGFTGSGWHEVLLKPGRHIYRLSYKPAAADTRRGDREDRIWLRGDASGRGRPVVLHEIRLYRP